MSQSMVGGPGVLVCERSACAEAGGLKAACQMCERQHAIPHAAKQNEYIVQDAQACTLGSSEAALSVNCSGYKCQACSGWPSPSKSKFRT